MVFIEHDVQLEKSWTFDVGLVALGFPEHPSGNGKHQKFTMGMAVLYAPFFAASHAYTLAVNPLEAHGFSMPYRVGIALAGLFYPLLGLSLLRRVLRPYVPDAAIAWTLVALFLGTNLFYYGTYRGAMSHGASFMLAKSSASTVSGACFCFSEIFEATICASASSSVDALSLIFSGFAFRTSAL